MSWYLSQLCQKWHTRWVWLCTIIAQDLKGHQFKGKKSHVYRDNRGDLCLEKEAFYVSNPLCLKTHQPLPSGKESLSKVYWKQFLAAQPSRFNIFFPHIILLIFFCMMVHKFFHVNKRTHVKQNLHLWHKSS